MWSGKLRTREPDTGLRLKEFIGSTVCCPRRPAASARASPTSEVSSVCTDNFLAPPSLSEYSPLQDRQGNEKLRSDRSGNLYVRARGVRLQEGVPERTIPLATSLGLGLCKWMSASEAVAHQAVGQPGGRCQSRLEHSP